VKSTVTTSDLTRFTGTWALDPERTSVTFRTKAMWVLPVKGTAKALAGDAEVTPGGAVTGTLVIDTASFDTENTKRDDHLRSEHFLESPSTPPSFSRRPVAAQSELAWWRFPVCSPLMARRSQ
jgi:polyisoprenoid-binding protein YceI